MFGTNYTGGITDYRSAADINSAMARVYGHMSVAVAISMLVSWFVGTTPELLAFFFTGVLKWIVIFAPLVAILAFTFASFDSSVFCSLLSLPVSRFAARLSESLSLRLP